MGDVIGSIDSFINCIRQISDVRRFDSYSIYHYGTIAQFKEKFGGLRFYASGLEHDGAYKLIEEAESKSYMICEECGTSGARRTIKGWLKTLCDKHYLESKGQ